VAINMSRDVPPRLATWLLGRLLPERDRDAVLGDLVEEYALRLRSASPSTVSRWYWGQVSRSIPPTLACTIRRGRWLGTIAVAGAVYLVVYTVEVAGLAAILRLLGPDAPLRVLSVIVGLTTMALGGYCAAWLRPRAAIALAAIGVIVVAILMSGGAPLWYQFAFLVAAPLAAWAGGMLCLSRRTKGAGRTA
jgi:hypothetical protein